MPLDREKIEQLLSKPQEPVKKGYPPPPQYGPLRTYEKEMRCASRNCRTSTYDTVCGLPYCTVHALRKLNEMIIEITGVEDWYGSRNGKTDSSGSEQV